jgi:hypothetical protein
VSYLKIKKMKTFLVSLYFVIAIVIFGSIGVTIPYVLDDINNEENIIQNLNQNLITYYIAIFLTTSIDYFMKLIDETGNKKKIKLLILVLLNIIIISFTIYRMYKNSKYKIDYIPFISIMCLIITYVGWWIANYKNPSLDPNNSFGGSTNKPLTNG